MPESKVIGSFITRLYWKRTRKSSTSDYSDKSERKPMFVFELERALLPLNEAIP